MKTTSKPNRSRGSGRKTSLGPGAIRLLPGLFVQDVPLQPRGGVRARKDLAAAEKAALWTRLEADARRIAVEFGLTYSKIEPEREGVRAHYGITYSDGTIRIRLRHATTARPLKYSSLINTVCHELAHLKHFNHGERFKKYYFKILRWARSQGIYRPSTAGAPPPVQLTLFRTRARIDVARED